MSPRSRSRVRAAALPVLLAASADPAAAVVGGDAASGPAYRASVMVLNARGGVCSGVVLARDVVLTAGHCAAGPDAVRVHFRDGDGAPVLLEPASRLVHPGYDPGAVAGRRRSIDLALVRTKEPLPDRFASATLSADAPVRGAPVQLGGYGATAPGDHRSTGTFRTVTMTAVEPHGPSRILLWAKSPSDPRAGACQGDSGGPFLDGGGAVVAIATWAAPGRGCGGQSQGVLVGPQRAWIEGVLAGWGREAAWR